MKVGGSVGDLLQAARDRQRRGDLGDPVGVELAEERLRGGEREGEVAALEAAPAPAGEAPAPGSSGARTSRAPRSAAVPLGQRRDLRAHPAQHQGRVVAQHRQLLGGDLVLGLAQPLGVVEADRGQHRDPRGDRVGRVEPPPQPGLDRRGLDPGRGEGDEGGGGGDLELGHRLALLEAAVDDLGRLRDALDRGGELGRADLLAVDRASVPTSARRAARRRPRR